MFRFEKLEIWQLACDVGDDLCDLADDLEKKKYYRFAEQLRGAALSISNNIAEGSGSTSNAEFKQFLNFARRSLFEDASMVAFFRRRSYVTQERADELLKQLDALSRKITNFYRSL